jgi:endogenous inhibitor of DNA gyrase (YacG/DUF329 family)
LAWTKAQRPDPWKAAAQQDGFAQGADNADARMSGIKLDPQTSRRLYAKLGPETVMQEIQDYECPYCGEPVEAVLDLSGGDQAYIEDCPVCCRPIDFSLQTDGEDWTLDVRSENE